MAAVGGDPLPVRLLGQRLLCGASRPSWRDLRIGRAVVVFLIWLSWSVNAVFFGGAFATEIEIVLRPAPTGGAAGPARPAPGWLRDQKTEHADSSPVSSTAKPLRSREVARRSAPADRRPTAARANRPARSPALGADEGVGTGQRWPRASTVISEEAIGQAHYRVTAANPSVAFALTFT